MGIEELALFEQQHLDTMEIDTIGEILNISMGSAATALSTLLSRTVNITTPIVSVIEADQLQLEQYEPAIGIEIEYVQGLSGTNLLVMKRKDIRVIVDLLVGIDDSEDENALNEMQVSAVSEIMNQMMGASATALSSFLGKTINISTPSQFDIGNKLEEMKKNGLESTVVSVKFMLEVEEMLHSEFVTIMSVAFTKELVKGALDFDEPSAPTPPPPRAQAAPPAPKPAPEPPKAAVREPSPPPVMERRPPREAPRPVEREAPPAVNVKPVRLQSFDDDSSSFENLEDADNFQLIMGVPLDVSVEIGRTKMSVKNILEVRQGSIVELDRQAGDPVDVIVNGQLIAKGDVVIVDDNFGVRITEIISKKDITKKIH